MAISLERLNCPVCSKAVKGKKGLVRHVKLMADGGDVRHQEAIKTKNQSNSGQQNGHGLNQEGGQMAGGENQSKPDLITESSENEEEPNNLFLEGNMSKIVESKSCPTCGAKHATLQKFEIPTVSVIDLDSFKQIETDIKKGGLPLLEALGSVKVGIDKGNSVLNSLAQAFIKHPKPTQEFIDQYWEGCPKCKEAWEKQKARIIAEGSNKHLVTSDHINNCPECQKAIADMLQPPAPAPVPPPTPAAAAEGETPKAEGEEVTQAKKPWDD